MFGMVKNGAISAKLKAKRGKLLNNDDYLALCSLGSVPAIAEYLKKTEGYKGFIEDDCRGTIHRDSLENMIYLSLIYDYESLYSFSKGPVRDFLLLYYLKREIWAIKSALYAVANKDRSIHLDIPARHKKIDTEAIETAKSKNELAEALHGTPYYDIVKEEGSIFEIETRLDKYYFDMMSDTVKNAGKEDKAAAEKLLGAETDATNILWIYRAKKYYGMPPERISKTLIGHTYRLKKDLLDKLTWAETAEDVVRLVENSPYRGLLNDTETEMGKALSSYLYKLNNEIMRKYPYSAVCALAYIHLKRTEIQNITAIIECVRYGVLPGEAYRHVIKECDGIDS